MHDIHYNNIMNNNINALLDDFAETAGAPEKQLRAFLAAGKSVVGLLPYFCPEEIVYAAGMIPFGLWGADRRVSEARRYFPAFICSILQTVLEQGILGELAGLRAVLIPVSCDSLKGLQSNWDSAVKDVPFIAAAQAQNRKTPAGIEFTASQYRKIGDELARLGGEKPADERVREAIRLYNRKRKAQRGFADAAGKRPDLVSPAQRSAVLKSAYYREVLPYTEQVETLTRLLLDAPAESAADGVSGAWVRIVTTGIVCDALPLLRIFGENRIVIAGDQVSQESVSFRGDAGEDGDPYAALSKALGEIEGCPVWYDPGKQRAKELTELVREKAADGVIYVTTKFCDPDEYDYVPVKRALDAAGIPSLLIETDRQMKDYARARTQVETFMDMINGGSYEL